MFLKIFVCIRLLFQIYGYEVLWKLHLRLLLRSIWVKDTKYSSDVWFFLVNKHRTFSFDFTFRVYTYDYTNVWPIFLIRIFLKFYLYPTFFSRSIKANYFQNPTFIPHSFKLTKRIIAEALLFPTYILNSINESTN